MQISMAARLMRLLLMQSTEETWHRELAARLLPGLKGVSARRWPWKNMDGCLQNTPACSSTFVHTNAFICLSSSSGEAKRVPVECSPPSGNLQRVSELFGMSHDMIPPSRLRSLDSREIHVWSQHLFVTTLAKCECHLWPRGSSELATQITNNILLFFSRSHEKTTWEGLHKDMMS